MLYWLSSCCIMTITIIVYKMVVLLMTYCTCTASLFFAFCLYPYCICGPFIFFTWAASQWAVRLLWQASDCMAIFCDIVVMMLLSENKYDDDDDCQFITFITFYLRLMLFGRRRHYFPMLIQINYGMMFTMKRRWFMSNLVKMIFSNNR